MCSVSFRHSFHDILPMWGLIFLIWNMFYPNGGVWWFHRHQKHHDSTSGNHEENSKGSWLIYIVIHCQGPRFKGIVQPKMKMMSLSTHHYADGGVGESTKHFLSSRGKQCCSQIQYNWSKWWVLIQTRTNKRKKPNMPSYCSCGAIRGSVSPNIQIPL